MDRSEEDLSFGRDTCRSGARSCRQWLDKQSKALRTVTLQAGWRSEGHVAIHAFSIRQVCLPVFSS